MIPKHRVVNCFYSTLTGGGGGGALAPCTGFLLICLIHIGSLDKTHGKYLGEGEWVNPILKYMIGMYMYVQ